MSYMLVEETKRSQIRNNPGPLSYFRGRFRGYGLYQWNIKYYDYNDSFEMEEAALYFLGNQVDNGKGRWGFEVINDILGRKVESYLEGRSGGWLVINSELSDQELELIDNYVSESMQNLKGFLRELREGA
jgi:hypothetical protein